MGRMIKRISLFVLLLSLQVGLSGHVLAQQPKIDFAQLEKAALDELKETGTPGAVVAVVSGDRIIFAKAFGVANVETNAPVTVETLFRIASVTKMFTATAVVSMAEQGKLKLDEPVGSYIKGLSPQLSKLTLHQLLTHTSGLVNETTSRGSIDDAKFADAVRAWNDDSLFYEQPGKMYSYSNPGLVLAGLALQESAKKPYAEMMSAILFKPLGMSRTTFNPMLAMTYPIAMGHQVGMDKKATVLRPFPSPQYLPAGGMISNVTDLSRFAIAFMNGGQLDGKQVLSPSAIAKLTTPYVDSYATSGQWKQGYGMRMTDYRGVHIVEHLGGTNGFGSQLRMIPEHRFAVIILTNSSLAQLSKTTEKAMELLLPLKAQPASPSEAAQPLTAAEMHSYIGTYQNGPLRFQIFSKDNRLFLKADEDEVPLKKIGDHLLSIDEKEEEATVDSALFKRLLLLPGANGTAEYLYFIGRALKRVPDDK